MKVADIHPRRAVRVTKLKRTGGPSAWDGGTSEIRGKAGLGAF